MANEKRLIDANELTDRLNHTTMVAYPNLFPGLLAAVEIVDDSPAVDAVEVVRCKDCKFGVIPYGDEHDSWIECSNIHGRPLFSCDGFCSHGERRTNE